MYIDGRSYKSGGSNAYPEGFDKLLECLIDIFGCEELMKYSEIEKNQHSMFQ